MFPIDMEVKGRANMSVEIVYNENGKTFQEVIQFIFAQQIKKSAVQRKEEKNEQL